MYLSQRRLPRAEVFPAVYICTAYTPTTADAALAAYIRDVEEHELRLWGAGKRRIVVWRIVWRARSR
jgi:hypothetical protein